MMKTSDTFTAVVPANAGTHNHQQWLWVPALASLGRDDSRKTMP